MKTSTRLLLTLLICLSCTSKGFAQEDPTDTSPFSAYHTGDIIIGKRKHPFLRRSVSVDNLAKVNTVGRRILYRIEGRDADCRSIGVLGYRLEPFFEGHPEAMERYRAYRLNRGFGKTMILTSLVSYTGWIGAAAKNAMSTSRTTVKSVFFKPNTLILMGGFFASIFGYYRLNINADKRLFEAVMLRNQAQHKKNSLPAPAEINKNTGMQLEFSPHIWSPLNQSTYFSDQKNTRQVGMRVTLFF